jgi:hypothetical protein
MELCFKLKVFFLRQLKLLGFVKLALKVFDLVQMCRLDLFILLVDLFNF